MKRVVLILIVTLAIVNAKAQTGCWKMVSSGIWHTIAIKTDGTLWAWGSNLGDFLLNYIETAPKQISTDNNWSTIATGGWHTIALKTDGTLWAWGWNQNAQLGDGTNTDIYVPTQIGTSTNWSSISAGLDFSVALKTDGSLWAWGDNNVGQLGDSTRIDKTIPTHIGNETNWVSVSAGGSHTIALKTDGTLWAWGYNLYGQIGNGTTNYYQYMQQVGSSNWAFVSAGEAQTIGIKSDGTLWAWGLNDHGQLGDGTTIDKSVLTQIGSSTNWSKVRSGNNHTLALKTDGTLWSWGDNSMGELGDSTTTNNNIPSQMGTLTNWSMLNTGRYYSMAFKTDGSLWSWGYNLDGELGLGDTLNRTTPTNIACSTTLPVTFVSFNAFKQENSIHQQWKTASEVNTSLFHIQRSTNAKEFTTIGTQKAVGKGNNTYSYTDDITQLSGTTTVLYYRLQEIDRDGKTYYSEVKKLSLSKEIASFTISPNPTKGDIQVQVNITETKQLVFRLYDNLGRNILEEKKDCIQGTNNITLKNKHLPAGTYFLQVKEIEGVRQLIIKN